MPDSPPDEEQGNFWDDLEDFFGWFDPDGWLADIGNLISEGLGVLAEPINALGEGFNNFIEGVGDFFENLIDSLGTWFENLGQWFDNLVNDLEQWFTNLGNDIGSWFEEVSNDITQFAENINNTMSSIISYLDPTSERFFLKLAFIPSDGFITEKFNEVKADFDNKLPIVGTLNELFDSITQTQSIQTQSIQSTKPKYEIELPDKWGGQKVEVINFAIIDPYIPYVKTIIRFMIWIPFLIKIYRRLPQIIY